LKDVAKRVPLSRMLIETDSPYLAPVPHRGKRNQPAWVRHVAEEIAALRELPVETVARATSDNFFALFGIDRHVH
jgi:TatD DNase family protein